MRIKYFLKAIIPFLFSLTSTFSNSMLVGTIQGDSYISLTGVINRGDLEKWIIPTFKNEKRKYINLNSTGGDVEEAMKIGRYFKANEFKVTVGGICYSSCVFLLAGGVERNVIGLRNVGIHRAYFGSIDVSLSPTQIKKIRDKLNSDLKAFLEEMDVNPSLIDAMNSYPPESMKILNDEELTSFRLNVKDANFEEKEVAKQAYTYNMTSSEWRVKSANAHAQCQGNKDEHCFVMKIFNISKSEAVIRIERFNDKCNGDANFCFRKHVARGEK